MTDTVKRRRIAQIAVEAIANEPDGYDSGTVEFVRAEAIEAGVSSLYVDLLPVTEEATR